MARSYHTQALTANWGVVKRDGRGIGLRLLRYWRYQMAPGPAI